MVDVTVTVEAVAVASLLVIVLSVISKQEQTEEYHTVSLHGDAYARTGRVVAA